MLILRQGSQHSLNALCRVSWNAVSSQAELDVLCQDLCSPQNVLGPTGKRVDTSDDDMGHVCGTYVLYQKHTPAECDEDSYGICTVDSQATVWCIHV